MKLSRKGWEKSWLLLLYVSDRYLGKVIPYTAMGLLIVYCLRDVSVVHGTHGLPELIAMAAVVGSYLWRRNSILSVIIGTVLYMFLLQTVF